MPKKSLLIGFLIFALPLFSAENEATPDNVISAMEGTFGVHPGERRNHTKGTCAEGTFTGSPKIQSLTTSTLFSGKSLPVIARFSLPGGNPKVPDTAKTPRGLALEIRLPDGSLQHMTMLNTPVFGAATPQTFYESIVATKPDPKTGKPDPEKIKAFRETHPDTMAQTEYLAANNPPPSWANSSYFGIHTFKFISKQHHTTLVRWRFVPRDGEKQMTQDELAKRPPDFLQKELITRLKKGPVQWDMMLTIGETGDTQDNPTLAWPKDREVIKAATLTITSASPQKGVQCGNINFDPLVMSKGIEPTNDPVLLFRSPAYAISAGKRLSGE